MTEGGSPPAVAAWVSALPDWIEVVLASVEPSDSDLDAGAGRIEADRRDFRATGTLGVLREAARRCLLDMVDAMDRLKRTNPHFSHAFGSGRRGQAEGPASHVPQALWPALTDFPSRTSCRVPGDE
jgi:hypothetical protein